MEVVYVIITLLLAIVISDIFSKVFSKVPIIFIQVIIGILISYLPFFEIFKLNPELFMIIIIKPLIFYESQHISIDELREYIRPIVSFCIPFVVITIVLTGILINFIFPTIPIFTTFILISLIIPTNSGTLNSIVSTLRFPKDILYILEGESLFNDSIAILMFDLVLHASITNHFHLGESISEFIYMVLGGLIIGFILGFIITHIRYWLFRKNFENAPMMVLIQIITPFVVFVIAEEYLHTSGILAVIVSGIVHSYERPILNLKSTKLQLISDNTWDVINYVLEGLVAIILGISLPEIINNIFEYKVVELKTLIIISFIVYLFISLLRFLWVFLQPNIFMSRNEDNISKFKSGIIYAVGAVNGTITLVIALSIPLTINNGEHFYFREEMIFIASMVILISLILPAIIFPKILPKKDNSSSKYDFNEFRIKMIKHTIAEMEKNNKNKDSYNLNMALKILRNQIIILDNQHIEHVNKQSIRDLLNETHKVEIESAQELVNQNKISQDMGKFFKRYIMSLNKNNIMSLLVKLRIHLIRKKIQKYMENHNSNNFEFIDKFTQDFIITKRHAYEASLSYLHMNMDKYDYATVSFVIMYYQNKLEHIPNEFDINTKDKDIKFYLSHIFQIENTFVQDSLEKELISPTLANELRNQISYDEMIYFNSI